MKNATNNAAKIATMKPGDRVLLSQSEGVAVYAERSGRGETLRFVRETSQGFEVFKSCNFAGGRA